MRFSIVLNVYVTDFKGEINLLFGLKFFGSSNSLPKVVGEFVILSIRLFVVNMGTKSRDGE